MTSFDPARRTSRTTAAALVAALLAATTPGGAAMAQDANDGSGSGSGDDPPSASESDPNALGWMEGFPPPDDRIIRFTDPDYFAFPKLRWTVCHFRELMPSTVVARGDGAARPLGRAIDEGLGDVSFTVRGSDAAMTWDEAFDANYSDGVVVLHGGRIMYERYAGCLDEHTLHGAMSVTKSLTGLLGEILVADGTLDETAPVASIVPELEGSAFGDATVRQVMDMTTSLDYSEDYADPDADVWVYAEAGSPLPKPEGYDGPNSYFSFLETVRPDPDTPHGEAFGYKTVNADALGWLIARTTGKSVAENLATRVWAPIGAEREAFYTVDSIGTPFAGGGFNAVLRDMARLGQLMLDEGRVDGEQVIPAAAVRSIRSGGSREAFVRSEHPGLKGWSYRSMWWVTGNEHGAYAARGVHGQTVYVDPAADMVIARFASHPVAANAANDDTSLPAYAAVAEHLMASSGSAAPEDWTAPGDSSGLVGDEWIVEDIDGGGVIDATQASLGFAPDGSLSGLATCNRMLGRYEIGADATPTGGSLAFDKVGATMMLCPPALMDQEGKLLAALETVSRFEIDDTGALVLHSDDASVVTARRR